MTRFSSCCVMAGILISGSGCGDGGDAPSASTPATAVATETGLPAFELVVETPGAMAVARVDEPALAAHCATLGIPAPPSTADVDPWAIERFYEAIRAIDTEKSAATVGAYGMVHHGYYRTDDAIACYEFAHAQNETDPVWLHLLGIAYTDSGEIDRAIDAFGEAIRIDDEDAAAHALLGNLLVEAGDARAARTHYERYVQLRPADTIGHEGLGRVAGLEGRTEDAIDALEMALQFDPANQPALYELARVLGRTDPDQARVVRERADRLPDNTRPVIFDPISNTMHQRAESLGFLRQAIVHYTAQRDIARAEALSARLALRVPDDLGARKTLTWCAATRGDWPVAAEHAGVALALDPTFAPGHEAIARALILTRDFDGALAAVERAVTVDPGFSHAVLTRGLVLAAMGHCDEALPILDSSLERFPKDVDGRIGRMTCLLNQQRRADALVEAKRILEISPGHPVALTVFERFGGDG